MPIHLSLSPDYGLSPIRLAAAAGQGTWPGILLHSTHLTWAFDAANRRLDDVAELPALAARKGLHRVDNPFTLDLPLATEPWTFTLPTPRKNAELAGPGLVVTIKRAPKFTQHWWNLAVTQGGRCRMLVAARVAFNADPADSADIMIEAAADGRMYGATIGVEF